MSGACDNFILEDQSCEWFELVQYVESFDMGINFLEGPPGPPGPAGEAIFIPSVSEDGWISWTNTAGLPNPDPVYIKGPPGGGGSGDYADLTNKPSINGVTLSGDKTTADLLIAFTAADVGLGNVANERQYSAQNPPPYPVTSVAGKTGAVVLDAADVGALPDDYTPPVTSVNGQTGAVVVNAINPPDITQMSRTALVHEQPLIITSVGGWYMVAAINRETSGNCSAFLADQFLTTYYAANSSPSGTFARATTPWIYFPPGFQFAARAFFTYENTSGVYYAPPIS